MAVQITNTNPVNRGRVTQSPDGTIQTSGSIDEAVVGLGAQIADTAGGGPIYPTGPNPQPNVPQGPWSFTFGGTTVGHEYYLTVMGENGYGTGTSTIRFTVGSFANDPERRARAFRDDEERRERALRDENEMLGRQAEDESADQ